MVAVNIRKDGDTLAGYKDAAENEIGKKAIIIWASVHGLLNF